MTTPEKHSLHLINRQLRAQSKHHSSTTEPGPKPPTTSNAKLISAGQPTRF